MVVVPANAGVVIVRYLTGDHNALISVLHSVAAWAVEFILYYSLTTYLAALYGVSWVKYSGWKLVLVVMGSLAALLYDGTLEIRRFVSYPEEATEKEGIKATDSDKQIIMNQQ